MIDKDKKKEGKEANMEKENSRLLTPEQRRAINDNMPSDAKYGDVFEAIAEAQLAKDIEWEAKTASILKVKCQARVERLRGKMESIITLATSSLIYCEGKYGHDNMARLNVEVSWQALKKEEGIE